MDAALKQQLEEMGFPANRCAPARLHTIALSSMVWQTCTLHMSSVDKDLHPCRVRCRPCNICRTGSSSRSAKAALSTYTMHAEAPREAVSYCSIVGKAFGHLF